MAERGKVEDAESAMSEYDTHLLVMPASEVVRTPMPERVDHAPHDTIHMGGLALASSE
jgi:hypothetical protein